MPVVKIRWSFHTVVVGFSLSEQCFLYRGDVVVVPLVYKERVQHYKQRSVEKIDVLISVIVDGPALSSGGERAQPRP